MMTEHPVLELSRCGPSGFALTSEDGAVSVRGRGEGWDVTDGSPLPVRLLRRTGGSRGQFRLLESDGGAELGCTLSLGGVGQRRELRYFLLGDGRLFRLVTSEPAKASFDLAGWVTPGAYLRARAHEAGWSIVPTPACGGIDDLLTLAVLLSAEILDAEEPLICEGGCECDK